MVEAYGRQQNEGHRPERYRRDGSSRVEVPTSPLGVPLQSYPRSLFAASRLSQRGNGPVQIALMRQMQRTYGNRAVRQFLQRTTSSPLSQVQREGDDSAEPRPPVEQVAPVQVKGTQHKLVAYAGGVKLQGKTKATFDGGNSETKDQVTEAATGCKGCKDKDCVKVSGTLVMKFTVKTTVTLPKVPTKPKLTPCQKERVQDAIDNILAPHEQEHVTAFETYNGEVEETFELTKCKWAMPAALKTMTKARMKEVEKERRASAKADSDALDPFNFDLDLDCEDA